MFTRDDNICRACPIHHNPVPPEGAEAPLLYVIGEAPGETEAKEHRPFIGASGMLLRKTLEETGIDLKSQVRIYNSVSCRPTNQEGGNRAPTPGEIKNCSEYLKRDIRAHRPAVILCAGKSALSTFRPDLVEMPLYKLTQRSDLEFEGTPIRVTSHPAFILRTGGVVGPNYNLFQADIRMAVTLARKGVGAGRDLLTWEVFEATDYRSFLDKFRDAPEIAFDFEASGLNPKTEDYEIAGIGIAREDYAAYLRIKDLFDLRHQFPEDLMRDVGLFLREFAVKGKLYVFNLRYENAA